MSDEQTKPVMLGFRENTRNEGHCRVSIFLGRNEGARGHAGEVVFRTDEWDEIKREIADAPWALEHRIDLIPKLGGA